MYSHSHADTAFIELEGLFVTLVRFRHRFGTVAPGDGFGVSLIVPGSRSGTINEFSISVVIMTIRLSPEQVFTDIDCGLYNVKV